MALTFCKHCTDFLLLKEIILEAAFHPQLILLRDQVVNCEPIYELEVPVNFPTSLEKYIPDEYMNIKHVQGVSQKVTNS